AIRREEGDRDRGNDEIPERGAHQEQEAADEDHAARGLDLVLVQARLDKSPELVEYVGEGEDDAEPEGDLDVADKLLLDVPRDDLQVLRVEAEVRQEPAEHLVRDEIGSGGAKDDMLEDELLGQEDGDRDDQHAQGGPEEVAPEFVEVLEERHFIGTLLVGFGGHGPGARLGGEYREVQRTAGGPAKVVRPAE